MTAAQSTCAYCGRETWLSGLEPCCEYPEHDGLVCTDIRGCVDVVLARLHERIPSVAPGSGEGRGACLALSDVATAVAALTDAAEWHEYRAGLACAECAAHPAELCDEHSAALDAAAAYRTLAGTLGAWL
jgi:hypothetical protein